MKDDSETGAGSSEIATLVEAREPRTARPSGHQQNPTAAARSKDNVRVSAHHRRSRRHLPAPSRDEAVVFSAVGLAAIILLALSVWGLRETDGDARDSLVADTAEPQVFDVTAGSRSDNAAEEFAAYYPPLVRAHPGDTIRFTNPTVEDPHSVTFGLRPDRSNQPRFATGRPLPHINGSCVQDSPLAATSVRCDGAGGGAGLPDFRGQAFYNSGIIPPGGGVFELRLAADLEAATYQYACVIHPEQVGTIEVVAHESATQRPRELRDEAEHQRATDVADLDVLRKRAASGGLNAGRERMVQAGAATARTSLNRFLPSELRVEQGDAVTWTNVGSVPHVVIFGGSIAAPEAADTPPTEPSGSTLTEGLFTAGPIGAPPWPRTEFTIRFSRPGDYAYTCTFHPGMVGTIVVR